MGYERIPTITSTQHPPPPPIDWKAVAAALLRDYVPRSGEDDLGCLIRSGCYRFGEVTRIARELREYNGK